MSEQRPRDNMRAETIPSTTASEPAPPGAQGAWHRANARTGFRVIADAAGDEVAYCPSYLDGPTLAEALANADLIAHGRETSEATPAPWTAIQGQGQERWLVRGGPARVIVAMVQHRRIDAAAIAQLIATRAVVPPEQAAPPAVSAETER